MQNMIEVVGRVYHFLLHIPDGKEPLKRKFTECQSTLNRQKLKDMCRTCWIQRIDAADIFQHLYLSIVDCLENISNDGASLWSQDALTDARSRSSPGNYNHQLCQCTCDRQLLS